MRNILYLNNYMGPQIIAKRENAHIFSQAANNKIIGITTALISADCKVSVLSSGLVNNKSFRIYRSMEETDRGLHIHYCPIVDIPFVNTLSSAISMYFEIRKIHRKSKVDNIIFYNYKPEVAWAACLAKRNLKIPITVEYEDGYSVEHEARGIKSFILKMTEKSVSGTIDSAIVVNSELAKKSTVPTVVVRGFVDSVFYKKCNEIVRVKNDKFTLAYTGGLDYERGIGILLESLKYFKADCNVIITGKGDLDSEDSRVDFRGFLPYKDIQEIMIQADVLLQCQLSKHAFSGTSFPSKLFEYIATGNVIVSSNVADVKRFAGDRIYYYDDDDPRKLAEVLTGIYIEWKNTGDIQKSEETKKLCEDYLPKRIGHSIVEII